MTADTVSSVEIPTSPVGRRIQWLLDAANSSDTVTVDEGKGAFADSFLAAAPAEAIAGMLNGDAGPLASAAPTKVSAPSDFAAVIDLAGDGEGMILRLRLMVDQDEPHKISMLSI